MVNDDPRVQDWGQSHVEPEEGRVSAQSLTNESKPATPPGDEIWAQKCHELDFQVKTSHYWEENKLLSKRFSCFKCFICIKWISLVFR